MRLLNALRGIWHAHRAARHYRIYHRHVQRRAALAVVPGNLSVRAKGSAAGPLLLTSIVGLAVVSMWIGATWRAWG